MTSLYMPQVLWRTGFSLIPLVGNKDTTRSKAPALKSWAEYQQRRATWPDIVRWVATDGYQLAVVTGRISSVVVVDFDDMALWEAFKSSALFSEFNTCLTVQTRRGMHLYLPVSSHGSEIKARTGTSWDLKAAGGYVVAPGSIINGYKYTIISGDLQALGAPKNGLVQAILGWLESCDIRTGKAEEPASQPTNSGLASSMMSLEVSERLPIAAACALYKTWASRGRNNALFSAARLLHDHFYDETAAIKALAELHVRHLSTTSHRHETTAARQQEALRTIHSAFRRSRRPTRPIAMRQLPNAIRECLNRAHLTCVARVLDALRSRGYGPGYVLSRREITVAVVGIVGHWSIRRAFAWLMSLPKTHPHSDELPDGCRQTKKTICDCLGAQNHQKIQPIRRGRQPALVALPSDESLAAFLGCRLNKASDVVILDEQRSVKAYRATLNREYLKRRPGTHALWWLAHRVGTSRQTVKRYNRIGEIQAERQVRREVLTQYLIPRLPDDGRYTDLWRNRSGDIRTPGYWLEDASGKCYPALQIIAKRLIHQKSETWLCIQTANYYFHASQPERASHVLQPAVAQRLSLCMGDGETEQKMQTVTRAPAESLPLRGIPLTSKSATLGQPAVSHLAHPSAVRPQRVLPPHNARRYQRSLPDPRHEYVAQRIHETYPAISLNTARRVVHLLGGQAVYRALAIVVDRQQRGCVVHDPERLFLTIAGYSTAVRQQKEEKKQHLYRVIWPRRVHRSERQDSPTPSSYTSL